MYIHESNQDSILNMKSHKNKHTIPSEIFLIFYQSFV